MQALNLPYAEDIEEIQMISERRFNLPKLLYKDLEGQRRSVVKNCGRCP